MKKATIYLISLALVLGMGMASIGKASASPPNFGVSFQIFYNELSPYGDWVMDPTHGYVWVPYVDRGFQPYVTNGYWTMTNFGNTWVSHYDWGWAPFHYGRWFWNDFYGWAWIPGYEWGPAWVSWRTGSGFYGWAPLGPGMHVGVNIMIPARHWVFVPQRRFRGKHFHRYFVPHHQVVNVYNRTTIINNTYVVNNTTYYTGPSRREIQRVTGSNVPVYQVNNASRPGRAIVQNNNVNIYRPEINRGRGGNEQARPSRAYTADEFRQRSAVQQRSTEQGRVNSAAPNRNTQATPSRNAQQPSQNQAVRGNANNGQNGTATRTVQSRPSNNGQVGTPNVRESNANRPNNYGANGASSPSRQQNPVVGNNASRQSGTTVQQRTNGRQNNAAVGSPSSGRQSSGTVGNAGPSRQTNVNVRSNSSTRQSGPAVNSSGGNTRSNSGTMNRSSNNPGNRSANSNRGGRGNE